ncbi:MAG TPA: hypothetical protein VFG14_02415, partial [Chthoniobacteraceae bacterium]|nr:hypothetical protein [Chthoniobacteraceae bacterium]
MALVSSVAAEEPQSLEADNTPSLDFPLRWLVDRAAPSIVYRSYVDVAGLPVPDGNDLVARLMEAPVAQALASMQTPEGVWNSSMLTVPESVESSDSIEADAETGAEPKLVVSPQSVLGIGTIPATRRLLEYGWDRETNALRQARRILFRLLAEDDDPNYLFELRGEATSDLLALRARN